MKTVEPQRFQNKKPEEIGFKGSPLAENPIPAKEGIRPSERPSVRTDIIKPITAAAKSETKNEAANTYLIEVPEQRRKIRHPFDIYEDQLEALKKIQIAEREKDGSKETPTLGDMAREALDDFIKAKAKRSTNIQIFYEKDKQKNK
jgi:hypothetical protein